MTNEPTATVLRTQGDDRAMLLDVLRGVAVLAVILLHSSTHALGHGSGWFEDYLWPVLHHGYLGVQLFFVISGYCIQGAVESARRQSHPLSSFAVRRFRRIYPPYWLSLVLVIVLALGTIVISRKSWSSVFPLTATDWLLNVLLLQGPFGAPDAALVYWSLSIEVQFYVLMGIGLLCGRRASFWIVSLSLLYLAWAIAPMVRISGTALAYWPEFVCGIAAYHAHHHGGKGRTLAAMLWSLTIAAAIAGLLQGIPMQASTGEFSTPYKQLFCVCCSAVLLAGLAAPNALSRFVPFRGLAAVGVISYSLYLTHEPLGSRVVNLGRRFIDLDSGGWILLSIMGLIVAFSGGYLFYLWCERPWLNRRPSNIVPKLEPVSMVPTPLQTELAQ